MAMFAKSLRLPSLGPPRFNMSRLMLATILSALAAVRLACSLKVSLPLNHNPKYFRDVTVVVYRAGSPYLILVVGGGTLALSLQVLILDNFYYA